MNLRRALMAATMLTLPAASQAQPVTGVYIGAGAGLNWLELTNSNTAPLSTTGPGGATIIGPGINTGNNFKTTFETGGVAVGSIGWGFGNGLRAEIEGNYRRNAVNEVTAFRQRLFSSGGYAQTAGLMANLFYDFDLRGMGLTGFDWIQPYIGAGVGYSWNEYNKVRGFFPGAAGQPRNGSKFLIDDTDGQFAYQAIVGVGYPLAPYTGIRNLTLTTEFRFMGTQQSKYQARIAAPATNFQYVGANRAGPGRVEPDWFNYSLLIGLRYSFEAPPPPPVAVVAPAPAPAPARTYLVFFDWDKADLTARAREIIAEAAQNVRRVQSTRIEVAGHADRSGSLAYNQRLSQRRADAVAAELVARGIARSEISISAYGESRPLVPTADGVREPQNRRVEIVLK
jgi:OmpA-OmpF porin, OOP family